jgi:hypothetical protein
MRSTAAIAGAVLAGLFAPAAPAQTTFGADLNRPANATYGCEILPTTDFAGRRAFLPSRQTTCTYLAAGALGSTQETTSPPFAGLVTAVRVKAGPVTGPMQITVLRATRSDAGFACCFFADATPTFTPAPNAVTTVPVRFFLRSDLDPRFGETVDRLAITVLAPGVPIPAHEIGDPGVVTNPGALAFFPAVGPGDAVSGRVDGAGIGGVQPLINADILAVCPSASARAAQSTRRCVSVLAPAATTLPARGGRVTMRLTCNAPAACTGVVQLQTRRTGAARNRTLASARISIAAAQTATVSPRLTRAGRAQLRGRRRVTAWLNGTVKAAGTRVATSTRVTLRR